MNVEFTAITDGSLVGLAGNALPDPSGTHWSTLLAYVGVLLIAFSVALIVTPLMRRLALVYGIIDVPDLKRKNHREPVAYLGGVGIFAGWIAGVAASYVLCPQNMNLAGQLHDLRAFPLSIVLGATVITLTGLIDDVWGIRARTKLGGQLFAAAALTSQQVGIDFTDLLFGIARLSDVPEAGHLVLPGYEHLVYFAATFLVAFFVLGGCNSVNLLDGLDGLAAGVVGIAMTGFLMLALLAGQDATVVAYQNPARIVLCLATIGAIFGFLRYNWNPARIFMGDAGSLLLGFLAVSAILLFGDAGGLSLRLVVASLIIFALPITDTSLAIIRRKWQGQPIFAPDAQHLHHLLRKRGLSVRQAVVTMYAAGILFAGMGIALIGFQLPLRVSVPVFVVVYGLIMIVAFWYAAHRLTIERAQAQAAADHPAVAASMSVLPEAPVSANKASLSMLSVTSR